MGFVGGEGWGRTFKKLFGKELSQEEREHRRKKMRTRRGRQKILNVERRYEKDWRREEGEIKAAR